MGWDRRGPLPGAVSAPAAERACSWRRVADGEPGRRAAVARCLSRTPPSCGLPGRGTYVDAVERAISAAGHVIVDMADFAASEQAPAQLCVEKVQSADVYVGCGQRRLC